MTSKPKHPLMKTSKIATGLALLVLLGAGAAFGWLTHWGGEIVKAKPVARAKSLDSGHAQSQTDHPTTTVTSKVLHVQTKLQGEIRPWESVVLFARVPGFVSKVFVDRGTLVKKGQTLVSLVAPELAAQRLEADAKAQAAQGTFHRLREAAKTPGAIAGNELALAEANVAATAAKVHSLRILESYLSITAPFDGVVTERMVHTGALVGPNAGQGSLLRLEHIATLRLVVAVPEHLVGAIREGESANFRVRANANKIYSGVFRRKSYSLEAKSRTMPVELEVNNADNTLAPGMYADVFWQAKRTVPTLLVPLSSIVETTERTYVIRVRDHHSEFIDVKRGVNDGSLVEVFGNLSANDVVLLNGRDEITHGQRVAPSASVSQP